MYISQRQKKILLITASFIYLGILLLSYLSPIAQEYKIKTKYFVEAQPKKGLDSLNSYKQEYLYCVQVAKGLIQGMDCLIDGFRGVLWANIFIFMVLVIFPEEKKKNQEH